MQTTSTFTVTSFEPTDLAPPNTKTGTPVGVVRMVKQFVGGLEGRAETLFTSAYDPERGVGTYVAMESFSGSIDGRVGTVNIAHTATTDGVTDRDSRGRRDCAGERHRPARRDHRHRPNSPQRGRYASAGA